MSARRIRGKSPGLLWIGACPAVKIIGALNQRPRVIIAVWHVAADSRAGALALREPIAMSEPVRVQVSLDEKAKERLRQMAGQGQASVAFVLGRVIESGLMEKKRLM